MFIFLIVSPLLVWALPKPFDFVEDAYHKLVNHSADPCDDFFRHACPIGSTGYLTTVAFKELFRELRENESLPAEHFKISEAFSLLENEKFKFDNLISSLLYFFDAACQIDKLRSITYMETILYQLPNFRRLPDKLSCKNLINNIARNQGYRSTKKDLEQFLTKTDDYAENFNKVREQANVVDAYFKAQVAQGIQEVEEMSHTMLEMARGMISDTPWARNHNVTEVIERYTSKMKVYTNLKSDDVELRGLLIAIDRVYSECVIRYDDSKKTKLFCLFFTSAAEPIQANEIPNKFSLEDNAYNDHPFLEIGLANFYHTQHAIEYASKLGYTGTTLGHEIGHSFIETHYDPKGLGFFSKTAHDCIQNQYNKTCYEFREKSCMTADFMFDDNGSDIFGNQLAYTMLQQHYGNKMKNIIPRLKTSYEKLFFYSYAFSFCTGYPTEIGYKEKDVLDEHAVDNIRVNAIAQLPGFREAFNCPDDSRMMRSATEQCIIYGENAPETRKLVDN